LDRHALTTSKCAACPTRIDEPASSITFGDLLT
jgi:hypothetical protein